MMFFRESCFSTVKALSVLIVAIAIMARTGDAIAETGGAAPIRVFLNAQEGDATQVQISGNGRIVAAKTNKGTALIDALSGRLIRRLNVDETDDVTSELKSISPTAHRVLILQNDVYQLWDAVNGRTMVSLKNGVDTDSTRTEMAEDGKTLASFARDRTTVRVWDTETGAARSSIKSGSSTIEDWVFLADSRYLATTSKDRIIRIWDTRDGSLVKSLAKSGEDVQTLDVAPSGLYLLTVGKTSAQLWEIASGRLAISAKGIYGDRPALAYSSDGSRFYLEEKSGVGRVFNTADGKPLASVKLGQNSQSVLFADNGNTLVSIDKDQLRSFDATTGKEKSPALKFNGEYLGDNEKQFVVKLANGEWQVRRLPDGAILATYGFRKNFLLESESAGGPAISTSAKGDITAIRSAPDRIELRNNLSWGRISECSLSDVTIEEVHFSDGGQIVSWTGRNKANDLVVGACDQTGAPFGAKYKLGDETYKGMSATGSMITHEFGGKSQRVTLKSMLTGKPTVSFRPPTELVSVVRVAPNGKLVAAGTDDNQVIVWNVENGKLVRSFKMLPGQRGQVASVAFSPDSTRVAAGTVSGILLKQWDIETGALLRTFTSENTVHDSSVLGQRGEGSLDVGSIVFSSGRIAASYGRSIIVWDETTGRQIWKAVTERSLIREVAFSADGGQLVSTSDDGFIDRWDATTGALLTSMIALANGEWILLTPEGFFDASSRKAEKSLNVARGLDVYSIDQFHDALFRPDLVKARLAGDPGGAVKAAAAKLDLDKVLESGSAPKVEISSPADGASVAAGTIDFAATVTEQGGGVGRIEWRLNGQPVGVATRGFERVPDKDTPAGAARSVSQKIVLDPGKNVVELLAYNARGLVVSQPARISITATGTAPTDKPRLFVLAVGVNEYYDGRLKLNYASSDARSVAAAFEQAGKGLYAEVRTTTVLDADVTKANLDSVFSRLAPQIRTTDVFVFFVAGHGRTLEGHYYFLPQDFRYSDQDSFATGGISQEQWQKWISAVPARKSVLIYDTCESGSVASDGIVVASRGLQRVEEQGVAYQKLRDATGRTILAASTDTAPALEGFHGHGVFSYAVIEALAKSQTNADGLIEVTGLISYVDDRVPDISYQVFHQHQIPQNKMVGSNFVIAKPTAMSADTPVASTAADSGRRMATAAKPTHVVVAPADVFAQAGGAGPKIQQLPAGTVLSVVKTEQGWTLVAKDGTPVGYVAAERLVQMQ